MIKVIKVRMCLHEFFGVLLGGFGRISVAHGNGRR